jgi:hypothetical protein
VVKSSTGPIGSFESRIAMPVEAKATSTQAFSIPQKLVRRHSNADGVLLSPPASTSRRDPRLGVWLVTMPLPPL